MKRLAFVSCFVVLLVPQVTQACVGDPFSVHFGDTLDLHMRVKGSETCRFGFKLGHASALHGVAIEQPPQHGTLAQADATHWIYQASRGYTGPDVLRVRATGETMGNRHIWSGDINYTYLIDVVP